jgi:hypothetical protein
LRSNPYETDLLLGEIDHYLYNLNQESYYDSAVTWYQKAITLDDKDCRGYWFLAYHYSTSDRTVDGISLLSKLMDSTIRSKEVRSDPDVTYSAKALWQSQKNGPRITFTSRPLGARFAVDSNWRMQINGYGKRLTAIALKPPVVTSSKGSPIGFSIALVVRVPEEGEKLADFMTSMMKMGGTRDATFPFANRYPSFLFSDKRVHL